MFDINIMFDLLVFPVLNVLYNQTSYRSGLAGIISQAILYSVPITILEYWFERYTRLIQYENWSWMHTFLFIAKSIACATAAMAVVHSFRIEKTPSQCSNIRYPTIIAHHNAKYRICLAPSLFIALKHIYTNARS